MTCWRNFIALASAFVCVGLANVAWGAVDPNAPDAIGVEERKVDIMSEGVRIRADIYMPKSSAAGPLPTIIMSHGWGGTASMLKPQATDFARAGYLVVAFDYRGWGRSDSRVILTKPAPDPSQKASQGFTAEVKEVREVVDPLDQATDIFNVIHWAVGESAVDKTRIGLWGTSFSGGLVVYVAARDPRIKALVSQVGYMGQPIAATSASALARMYDDSTRRARGELDYPPPRAKEIGNLQGGPIREKFLLYAPIEDVARAKNCAMLFIAAENEELFDNKSHPELAYARAAEPRKYAVIPGISHYGIYGQAREEATRLAIEWFDRHLKR
jgi:dienelactone hydrolase